ncbi:MAG: 50S ribosomal protein L6 [bacterium]|nr:50S ribosomal protein L6 [bacterium]
MSKIGKKPITIPEGVEVNIAGQTLNVKGPKGHLTVELHPSVAVKSAEGQLAVSVPNPDNRKQRALWGTFRSLVQNAITGVSAGFERKLEISGVGYRASVADGKLVLNIGFSHPVELPIFPGLEVKVEKSIITVSGIDKQEVGQFAALVRSRKKPEPYKGKGIKYAEEVIRRKAGKVVKSVGAG